MSVQEAFRALIEAGLQAHNQGNIAAAKDAYQRTLAGAPNHPQALHLLGIVHLQSGEIPQAIDCLERAARQQNNNSAVIGNLAQAYFAGEFYEQARETFRRASRLDPRNAQFRLGVANSLALQGKHAEAEALLRKLTRESPRAALAWFNLGNVQRDQGRATEALESYRTATALDTGMVEARNNLAEVLQKLLRFEDAEREYRECIRIAPDYLLSQRNLASILLDLGRFADAAILCRAILERVPEWGQIHALLGTALAQQGNLLAALACHRTAANLAPGDSQILANFASALADAGQAEESLQYFNRALELDPASASTHLLLGYALLGQGRLAEGWNEYVYRPWPAQFRQKYPMLRLVQALPAELAGKHVCVVREQGLGDEIFFLRFAPQLQTAGARITYCSSDKIASLLERVPCIAQVRDEKTPPLAAADAILLAGDLPYAAGHRIGGATPAIPPPLPLVALPARLAQLSEQLAALGAPPYIGVIWRGGTAPHEQRNVIWGLHKEIGLQALAGAVRDMDGTFIVLQRNPAAGELRSFSQALGREAHDLTHLNDDLEGMLALLTLLDEYIGVSNTNMHLRASAGRTGRVLVPCPPDWRWMFEGASSSWFPGFTIYRQSPQGAWGDALAALKRDISNLST